MKKFMTFLVGAVLLLTLAFMLGPRPERDMTVTFDPASLGEDLDAYLAKSEASVENLKPGTEKEIIWNNPVTKSKRPYAVVYVHGFSATKYETRPVTDYVANALGANVYYTRMTGHGSDGESLANANLSDWANDFAEAIAIGERIGEKVILIATSNGAAISTWGLAQEKYASNVVASAFISANYELKSIDTTVANLPWAETLLPMVGGEEYAWEPYNEEQGKWWTYAYPSKAIFPMTALLKNLDELDMSAIKTPTLFVYSPEDTVVSVERIEANAANWGGEAKLAPVASVSNPSKHVIAGDIMAPENTQPVTKMILDFVASVSG